MTRTPAPPFDDRGMWRCLVGRSHPDAGGEHELFIWTVATRDAICGGEIPRREGREQPFRRRETSTSSAGERVRFEQLSDFEVLSDRALSMAESVAETYGFLLTQVVDCYAVFEGPLYDPQRRGATYRSLAAIGHQVGMTKAEHVRWYRVAEAIPLSQRHASHILSRLKGQAA
jgi:hypothetical protein